MTLESAPYLNEQGVYDLDIEWEVKWNQLSDKERSDHVKYLRLIYEFRKNPKNVNHEDKKWIFANIDIEIDIIPDKWHRKYGLSVNTNTDRPSEIENYSV